MKVFKNLIYAVPAFLTACGTKVASVPKHVVTITNYVTVPVVNPTVVASKSSVVHEAVSKSVEISKRGDWVSTIFVMGGTLCVIAVLCFLYQRYLVGNKTVTTLISKVWADIEKVALTVYNYIKKFISYLRSKI